jgi:hypothetical protein
MRDARGWKGDVLRQRGLTWISRLAFVLTRRSAKKTRETTAGSTLISSEESKSLQEFAQGDILDIAALPIINMSDSVELQSISSGKAVIITQTCDVVQDKHRYVHLAPVVQLPEPEGSNARDGKLSQYVHIPALGSDYFGDLAQIATFEKELIASAVRSPGVTTDEEVRNFGRAVGRRFSRFAFPDEVVPWLRPLEVVMQSKHDKQESAVGRAAQKLASIRVAAEPPGWRGGPPYSLTLYFILKSGTLPTFIDDEPPDLPDRIGTWLRPSGTLIRTPSQIAEKIEENADDPAALYHLRLALGEAWAASCTPARRDQTKEGVMSALSGPITADVTTAEDFRYSHFRRTEELDLDHLSPALPE